MTSMTIIAFAVGTTFFATLTLIGFIIARPKSCVSIWIREHQQLFSFIPTLAFAGVSLIFLAVTTDLATDQAQREAIALDNALANSARDTLKLNLDVQSSTKAQTAGAIILWRAMNRVIVEAGRGALGGQGLGPIRIPEEFTDYEILKVQDPDLAASITVFVQLVEGYNGLTSDAERNVCMKVFPEECRLMLENLQNLIYQQAVLLTDFIREIEPALPSP